jgi:hypothetical protein
LRKKRTSKETNYVNGPFGSDKKRKFETHETEIDRAVTLILYRLENLKREYQYKCEIENLAEVLLFQSDEFDEIFGSLILFEGSIFYLALEDPISFEFF